MKQLVLHIGTHKTGSTSFQKSMRKNADALVSLGVRPILSPVFQNGKRVSGKRANHVHFLHLVLRPEVLSGARFRGEVPVLSDQQRRRQLDRLAQRLADFEDETLLLSAEGLCFLRNADEQALLRRFLKGVGREVRTMVVFRNEADWRTRWENQLIKEGGGFYEIVRAEPDDVSILGDWYFDKREIQEFWSPFGLCQINYEAHPNIVEALYSEIGLPPGQLQTDIFKNPGRQKATPE